MKAGCVIFFLLINSLVSIAIAQAAYPRPFKTLTVADGLPQSYISGLVQDSTGFIWIGTRDGLARYDGRKFKIFRHIPGDSTTLSDNIITGLYLDKRNRLWIAYEAGDIDVLNTATESLLHFTRQPACKAAHASVKPGQSFAEDAGGNVWMLEAAGKGIFIADASGQTISYYSAEAIGLHNRRIASIAGNGKHVLMITDSLIVVIDANRKLVKIIPHRLNLPVGDAVFSWKTIPFIIRRNGDAVIVSNGSLLLYNLAANTLEKLALPVGGSLLNFCIAQDNSGRIFFEHNHQVYVLSAQNKLGVWRPHQASTAYGFKSMLVDRSGVLWLGGNGSGILQYDLRLPRLSGVAYQGRFHEDVFQNCLHISKKEFQATSLYQSESYYVRWVKDGNKDYWIARAGPAAMETVEVYHYANGRLTRPSWQYSDNIESNHVQINGLAMSPSGSLWGIDFYLRPVLFDTATKSVTVYSSLDSVNTSYSFTVSSLFIDEEETFWISTALNGLIRYDKRQQRVVHYLASDTHGALPTNQLMNIVPDDKDKNILWIGSLGGGLIKFNKATGKCTAFTIKQGLPNNTVYAVEKDARGVLWCSSNKGIFSFDPKRGSVLQSFTSKDGLPGDEFNRYHFFKLPDGQFAFGGVEGYTVFNPLTIASDDFQPPVALTAIRINNVAAGTGTNSIDKLTLPYHQNFLTFEFAALEYNITEKLQYRYMLEGFDKDWVYAGNDNIAVYTKVPPGNYELKINATNTAGVWSKHVKILPVVITPPFWQTWWFIALLAGVVAVLLYFVVQHRINTIRKEMQQRLHFRREASELRAQALRAQMNPHFVFNSLNSIKALIQEDKKREAVTYLTTFSKLIRNQLNNAEQEVSLHDELETCRLYAQLEALRFGDKIVTEFLVEEDIDTYSLKVPPLLIQPFIENAIWHGVLPRKSGKVTVSVVRKGGHIHCLIDDNGIGRELAMRNKSTTSSTYESKGMKLVKNRLNLHNSIHKHKTTIEVVDKRDAYENPSGTLVMLTFKEES